jgi:hypothetical protein
MMYLYCIYIYIYIRAVLDSLGFIWNTPGTMKALREMAGSLDTVRSPPKENYKVYSMSLILEICLRKKY